jgi:hypothetical protein
LFFKRFDSTLTLADEKTPIYFSDFSEILEDELNSA